MIGIYTTALLILLFGLLNLFGLSHTYFLYQLRFFIVGLVVFFIVKKVGQRFFFLNAKFFYWLFIFFMALLFLISFEIRGARRWITVSFLNFQPSEYFKIFYIIYFAEILSNKTNQTNRRYLFLMSLIIFALPAFLIFKQPDLGTTLVLLVIFLVMMLASGIPKNYILKLILFFVLIFPVFWFLLQPYQRMRFLSFLNPAHDAQGSSYNMIQSLISIGSGQIFGKGLGFGTQSKLFFLPENYTDFAYAALVEQFGFFGGGVVLILFFLLCLFILKRIIFYHQSSTQEGKFSFFYHIGVFSFILFQTAVNIGMNLGIAPITGITLPLVSYGGSSLVSLFIAIALLP